MSLLEAKDLSTIVLRAALWNTLEAPSNTLLLTLTTLITKFRNLAFPCSQQTLNRSTVNKEFKNTTQQMNLEKEIETQLLR